MIPKQIRNVSFPGSVRGYDRDAVDEYVKAVNQVIAELEISSSPRAAVRHALEQVGEQTSGILQRAREAAEEITASARQEADELLERAKAEAAEIVVNASTAADRSVGSASSAPVPSPTLTPRSRTPRSPSAVVASAYATSGEVLAAAY